jgi:N6-L-threonylcarbamoyladenine synthase
MKAVNENMKILAIESSCDETALAVVDGSRRKFLREDIASQIFTHRPYGGVVPELATQGHLAAIPVLIARWKKSNAFMIPDCIAVTYGPGLAGGLAMGLGAARALSIYYRRPLLGINHLRGHALSPFIPLWEGHHALEQFFPHIGLLVSGGNTLLFTIGNDYRIRILAQTVDDAAGEALDKGAKLLGFPYPGGVQIEKLAASGDPHAFPFPCPMLGDATKFSFSGLKTSLLYLLKKMGKLESERRRHDLCASYLYTICRALTEKIRHAIISETPRSIGLSGGVSQNRVLRKSVAEICATFSCPFLPASTQHCGDNASMIAFAALMDGLHGEGNPPTFLPKLRL